MFHSYVRLPEGNSWLPAQVMSTHPRLRVTFLGSSKFKSSTKPPARLKPPPILSGAVGPGVILLEIHHMFPMVSRLFLFIFDLPSILRLPSHVPTMFQQLYMGSLKQCPVFWAHQWPRSLSSFWYWKLPNGLVSFQGSKFHHHWLQELGEWFNPPGS